MTAITSFLLILSGFASLTYQVTWVRLIGLSLGSTSVSISTVLTAFFLGLALGSYLTERITRNAISSFMPYIVLEIIIGVSGFVLLPVLLNLDWFLSLAPAFGSTISLKFVLAVALLLVPTTCMGATFPVMAAIMIRRHKTVGAKMSQLYGFNTLGAVIGAAATGFILIPRFGLDGAIFVAILANIIVALIALMLNFAVALPEVEAIEPSSETSLPPESTSPLAVRMAALVLMATGFASIATQIGWTKYLAIFTGSTIYGFSAILATFLAGVALGSLVVERLIDRLKSPILFVAFCLISLSLTFFLARAGLSALPFVQTVLNEVDVDYNRNELIRYGTVSVIVLLPTLILGALFPVNLKVYCGGLLNVRARIGRAYALNTVASIAGSLFAGFIAIPLFGTDVLLTAMAFFMLAITVIWLFTMVAPHARARYLYASAGVVVIGLFVPHLDYRDLIATVGYDSSPDGSAPDFYFLEEGKAGVISLSSYDDRYLALQSNGLNESSFDLENSHYTLRIEALLGAVPFMLNHQAQDAFVVGYGAGHTVTALTRTDLSYIKVVELEPAIVRASQSIEELPNVTLQDSRIDLEFNDARNSLLLSDRTYDIIVSQPSHPWVAGAANVFTQQFWEIASSRLNQNGVFGQWINLFGMDAVTLKSVMKAFYAVFPHGFAMVDDADMIMIGSMNELRFDLAKVDAFLAQEDIKATLGASGIKDWRDLIWYHALSRREIIAATQNATPNTDTNLFTEVRLSGRFRSLSDEENPEYFVESYNYLDILDLMPEAGRATHLRALGNYFLKWDADERATQARKMLSEIDADEGRALQYDIMLYRNQVSYATLVFDASDHWGDAERAAHANVLIRVGLYDQAMQTLGAIRDQTVRDSIKAKILYRLGRHAELIRLSTDTGNQTIWADLAEASRDPNPAPAILERLSSVEEAAIDVAQLKLQVAAIDGQTGDLAVGAADLNRLIEAELKYLKEVGEFAVQTGDAQLLDALIARLQSLKVNSEVYQQLQSDWAKKSEG